MTTLVLFTSLIGFLGLPCLIFTYNLCIYLSWQNDNKLLERILECVRGWKEKNSPFFFPLCASRFALAHSKTRSKNKKFLFCRLTVIGKISIQIYWKPRVTLSKSNLQFLLKYIFHIIAYKNLAGFFWNHADLRERLGVCFCLSKVQKIKHKKKIMNASLSLSLPSHFTFSCVWFSGWSEP